MEVDLIIEHANGLTPVEIKSTKAWNRDFFVNLEKWNGYSGNLPENAHVIYGRDENFKNSWGIVHSWNSLNDIDF